MDTSLLRQNEPLANHSTFRVGGPAQYFFEAGSAGEVEDAVEWAEEQGLPYFILGMGSNVLFKDKGFPGLVIKISASEVRLEGDKIIAEAGAKWPQISGFMSENDLGGLEEFSYLPGTVGGAVCGNAGCFGKEIADVLSRARILGKGEVGPEYFDFKYRWSVLQDSDEVLLKAAFRVHSGFDKEKMERFARERREKQPPGMSAGSFFKNPEGKSAGELIEKCGLKGKSVGGAKISEKHANFIINTGGASAGDILDLADMAKKEVKGQFNIELEEEVRVIG